MAELNRIAPVEIEVGDGIEELAEMYIKFGVVPPKKRDDARHVAIATTAHMNILVSWNHRHLANDRKKQLFNAVNRLAGPGTPM